MNILKSSMRFFGLENLVNSFIKYLLIILFVIVVVYFVSDFTSYEFYDAEPLKMSNSSKVLFAVLQVDDSGNIESDNGSAPTGSVTSQSISQSIKAGDTIIITPGEGDFADTTRAYGTKSKDPNSKRYPKSFITMGTAYNYPRKGEYDKTSSQYYLAKLLYKDTYVNLTKDESTGAIYYKDYMLVAMGQYFAYKYGYTPTAGMVFEVEFNSGDKIKTMVADWKANDKDSKTAGGGVGMYNHVAKCINPANNKPVYPTITHIIDEVINGDTQVSEIDEVCFDGNNLIKHNNTSNHLSVFNLQKGTSLRKQTPFNTGIKSITLLKDEQTAKEIMDVGYGGVDKTPNAYKKALLVE